MKIILLAILIWSILDSGWSITDVNLMRIEAELAQIQILVGGIRVLKNQSDIDRAQIQALTAEVQHLKNESQVDRAQIQVLNRTIVNQRKEMNSLRNGNLTGRKEIQVLVAGILYLRNQSEFDRAQIQVLKRRAENQTRELGLLTREMEVVRREMESLKDENQEKAETLEGTSSPYDSILAQLEERTIAFDAVMDHPYGDIPTIFKGSIVRFSNVQLNQGNGYNFYTGVFTVPPGGSGYYYFSSHFTVYDDPVHIDLRVNDRILCTMYDDSSYTNTGCDAVVFLSPGDEVKNVYREGDSNQPLIEYQFGDYNGFKGFRI